MLRAPGRIQHLRRSFCKMRLLPPSSLVRFTLKQIHRTRFDVLHFDSSPLHSPPPNICHSAGVETSNGYTDPGSAEVEQQSLATFPHGHTILKVRVGRGIAGSPLSLSAGALC